MPTVGELYAERVREKPVPMLGKDPPVAWEGYTNQTREIDHSGDWWVLDRDTGEIYQRGLPTRESAEKWARRNHLSYLSQEESEKVLRADPICAAYSRKHPHFVLASLLDRH